MNILFLTNEYSHESLPESGGTGVFISNISKILISKGHKVYVFSLSNIDLYISDLGVIVKIKKNTLVKNQIYKLLRSVTRKVSFLNNYHFKLKRLEVKEIAKQLNQFIEKNKLNIDIIETHDFNGISLYLNNKIPYIVRCHGSFSIFREYFYKNFNIPKLVLDCEFEANRKAKNIITISKYSQKINHELFKINKSKLIYNGVNTSLYKAKEEVKVIEKSIFYFGNISLEKGADVAIEVFLNVIKFESNLSLHFMGIETNYKSELLKIIKENNIEDKVIFHGFQNTDSIIKLISSAEVVIFPSKGETFGMALCETMSIGKPVVVANIPAFNEIVTDKKSGFIANSVQDYSDAIQFVFENPNKAAEIGKNARNTIINRFSIDKMVDETLKYYQEVIDDFKS